MRRARDSLVPGPHAHEPWAAPGVEKQARNAPKLKAANSTFGLLSALGVARMGGRGVILAPRVHGIVTALFALHAGSPERGM